MFVLHKDGEPLTELRAGEFRDAITEAQVWAEAKMFQIQHRQGIDVYVRADGDDYVVRTADKEIHRYTIEER